MSTESTPPERHEIIGLIPARAGSKRLPNKNRFRLTAGLTLVQWTLLQAIRSGVFDRLVVSTDSDDIWSDAQDAFPPITAVTLDASTFLVKHEGRSVAVERHYRKPEHATDQASSMDVLQDYLSEHRPEINKLVLLQPTSPFRFERTIQRVIEACSEDHPFVFTAKTVPPVYCWTGEKVSLGGPTAVRQQQLPETPLVPNGNLYCWKIDYIPDNALDGDLPVCLSIKPAVILPYNPLENVDIDEKEDANMAGAYLTDWITNQGEYNFPPLPEGLVLGTRLR